MPCSAALRRDCNPSPKSIQYIPLHTFQIKANKSLIFGALLAESRRHLTEVLYIFNQVIDVSLINCKITFKELESLMVMV